MASSSSSGLHSKTGYYLEFFEFHEDRGWLQIQDFANLSAIAKLVLTSPHSSAGEERVFSVVRLNKTPYRSSLSLDNTLCSILTVKMHNLEPCYKFEPPKEMLEKSKKAT